MRLEISKSVLLMYPRVNIGYLIASIGDNKNSLVLSTNLRLSAEAGAKNLISSTEGIKGNPVINSWREVFKTFKVNETCRSSVEALVRRAGRIGIPQISPIVDAYNSCSVMHIIPMGGYDLSQIRGDITLRHGHEKDSFEGLGMKPVAVEPQHIVYADSQRPICWLWNYRDRQDTVISKDTKHAIFFFDSCDSELSQPDNAMKAFVTILTEMGCVVHISGVLSARNSSVIHDLSQYGLILSGQSQSFFQPVNPVQEKENETLNDNSIRYAIETGDVSLLARLQPTDLSRYTDSSGTTLLHRAVRQGEVEVVRWLLQNKPNDAYIHAQNDSGCSALHISAMYGYSGCAELLLQHGADPYLQSNVNKKTPYDIALEEKYTSIEVLFRREEKRATPKLSLS